MRNKTLSALFITVGLVITVVSAGADVIGLGSSASVFEEFGPRQIIGTAMGLVILLIGLRYWWQSRRTFQS